MKNAGIAAGVMTGSRPVHTADLESAMCDGVPVQCDAAAVSISLATAPG
jgi:hypothetical protein